MIPQRITGRISVHPRGFGFVTTEATKTGEVLSAFVAPPDLNPLFTGDVVRATLTRAPDGRYMATEIVLVERPRREVFGEVVMRRGAPFLRIDREVANTDWPLDPAGVEVQPGDAVVARIADDKVVLVRKLAAGEDASLVRVICRHGLLVDFDPAALEEAHAAAARPHSLGARRDLRALPTVTVDAPSTRDIDDAISVLPAGPDGALRLFVSIADVAEFIPAGGALDQAARERATSVYLAGRVLPMLPEELSAGSLSLLPDQDRSALTCELRIDPEGRVTAADVYESLIRSWARLNYEETAAFLDAGRVSTAMAPLREAMPWFRTASARLAVARARRGGVVFARDEARVAFDPQTGEAAITTPERLSSAHAMIERFMVAANEAIAEFLVARGVPSVYRVHDEPDAQGVAELAAAGRHFGIEAGFGHTLTPLALAAFDVQVAGSPNEPALRSLVLRALGPARYTVVPGPHFGLAAPLYLHFTSPLRRYADLTVHRTLKQYLRGRRDWAYQDPEIEKLAAHINSRARTAARAERDWRRMLAARAMSGRVGETFDAHVTRVRPFGLVVQLDATLVEGMLPAESLPEGPYRPDARETVLQGPVRSFAVGAALRVRLVSVDPAAGRIEFVLAE